MVGNIDEIIIWFLFRGKKLFGIEYNEFQESWE